MFIDLDHFKDINDSLGHAAGDQLLIEVAARLDGALRESDTVGRLGGDEFIVLVEGPSVQAGVGLVAQRVLDVLREPFQLTTSNGIVKPSQISATIGIAEGDRPSADALFRDADVALYRAKAAGRNRYALFEASMRTPRCADR